jgi:hypothetical protein
MLARRVHGAPCRCCQGSSGSSSRSWQCGYSAACSDGSCVAGRDGRECRQGCSLQPQQHSSKSVSQRVSNSAPVHAEHSMRRPRTASSMNSKPVSLHTLAYSSAALLVQHAPSLLSVTTCATTSQPNLLLLQPLQARHNLVMPVLGDGRNHLCMSMFAAHARLTALLHATTCLGLHIPRAVVCEGQSAAQLSRSSAPGK